MRNHASVKNHNVKNVLHTRVQPKIISELTKKRNYISVNIVREGFLE